MRPSLLVLLVATLGALACTHSPAPSAPAPAAAPPAETSRLLPPLQLAWEQRTLTATNAIVLARIKRIAPIGMPMLVRVEVPAGATLVGGRQQFTLEPNTEASEVTEAVALDFNTVPEGDLVLRVDSESKSTGFHFAAAYRFGRAEPAPPPAAQPAGPPVKKGERTLGPSVPLK